LLDPDLRCALKVFGLRESPKPSRHTACSHREQGKRKFRLKSEEIFDCCFIDQENIERAEFNVLEKRKHSRNFCYYISLLSENSSID